ncbi:MAG: SCP2 sterol-binding domain-containing protein [Deltaproteobacteria bacterium]|nr:SCP2 sterol-binding domain-containing protein [Deltaproteobacteria bacterium]
MDISNAKQLSSLLEGRSDQEILTAVQELGLDSALEKTFEGMVKAFLPAAAGGQSAVIQWDISTPAGIQSYQLKVADGACTAAKGTADKARVTLGLDIPTFLRLITGKANGQQAFFSGKLKLSGDMMFAMTQEKWFDKNFGG